MLLLETVNQALLSPPFRAVLSFGALVRFGHNLLDADNGDRLKWCDVIGTVLSVPSS
jgi:hypothetical protein